MSQPNLTPRLEPQLRRISGPDGQDRIELSGPWILRALEHQFSELTAQLADCARDANRHWDLSGVTRLDHAGALLLWRAWGSRRASHLTVRPEHEVLFSGMGAAQPPVLRPQRDWRAPVAALGNQLLAFGDHALRFVLLVG